VLFLVLFVHFILHFILFVCCFCSHPFLFVKKDVCFRARREREKKDSTAKNVVPSKRAFVIYCSLYIDYLDEERRGTQRNEKKSKYEIGTKTAPRRRWVFSSRRKHRNQPLHKSHRTNENENSERIKDETNF